MKKIPVKERVSKYFTKSKSCWIWTGAKKSNGYGHIIDDNGNFRGAHVIIYEILKGVIPRGYQIDHLCKNKLCVNPDHLEAVTQRENILRSNAPSALNAKKINCPNGHLYDRKGKRGDRYCSYCKKEVDKKRKNRHT